MSYTYHYTGLREVGDYVLKLTCDDGFVDFSMTKILGVFDGVLHYDRGLDEPPTTNIDEALFSVIGRVRSDGCTTIEVHGEVHWDFVRDQDKFFNAVREAREYCACILGGQAWSEYA